MRAGCAASWPEPAISEVLCREPVLCNGAPAQRSAPYIAKHSHYCMRVSHRNRPSVLVKAGKLSYSGGMALRNIQMLLRRGNISLLLRLRCCIENAARMARRDGSPRQVARSGLTSLLPQTRTQRCRILQRNRCRASPRPTQSPTKRILALNVTRRLK